MLYVNSLNPGTVPKGPTIPAPNTLMGLIWAVVNEAFSTKAPVSGVSGTYSTAAVAQAVFTVTIGTPQTTTGYKVFLTPTSFTATVSAYVTNKTLTTFDVTYIVPLTGAVSFDWLVTQ